MQKLTAQKVGNVLLVNTQCVALGVGVSQAAAKCSDVVVVMLCNRF